MTRVGAAVGEPAVTGYAPWREGDPVPPRPRTELRRVTVCEHDERLEVKSVRGIGFSWRCDCGEHGKRWRKRVDAVVEKHEHELTHR